MEIKAKILFKDYLRFIYLMTYRNPWIIFLSGIGLTIFIGSLSYFMGFKILFDSPPYFQLILGLLFVIVVPISTYRNAKRNYFSNKFLQEDITYEITDEKLKIVGESFNSELNWDKIYKVTEFGKWILVFHNMSIANLIPKSSFGKELSSFKKLIINETQIKNNFSRVKKVFPLFLTLLPIVFFILLFTAIPVGFIIIRAVPETYLIPDNYSGEILVFFDQPNGNPPKMEGKRRIYQIPENGILFTQFKWNSGFHNRNFFMVKNNTKVEIDEVSASYTYSNKNDSNKISVIDKKSYYYTDADNNKYLFRATRFIVGKRKDFNKYDVEIKTDSIIENVFNNE